MPRGYREWDLKSGRLEYDGETKKMRHAGPHFALSYFDEECILPTGI